MFIFCLVFSSSRYPLSCFQFKLSMDAAQLGTKFWLKRSTWKFQEGCSSRERKLVENWGKIFMEHVSRLQMEFPRPAMRDTASSAKCQTAPWNCCRKVLPSSSSSYIYSSLLYCSFYSYSSSYSRHCAACNASPNSTLHHCCNLELQSVTFKIELE